MPVNEKHLGLAVTEIQVHPSNQVEAKALLVREKGTQKTATETWGMKVEIPIAPHESPEILDLLQKLKQKIVEFAEEKMELGIDTNAKK